MGDIQQDAASIEQFQAIWQKALDDYKERTDRDLINDKEIQEWNIRTADNFTEIVSERDRHFNDSRKKYQKARDNLKACIQPVEQLSAIATSALSFTPFAPAATIFGAGMFLISMSSSLLFMRAMYCTSESEHDDNSV